jgi:hypothetical protein
MYITLSQAVLREDKIQGGGAPPPLCLVFLLM